MRWLMAQWRRFRVRNDLVEHTPDAHPGLQPFADGERFVWKGVVFRVRARYTDPEPVLILEPVGSSHGAKLKRLRELRDDERFARAERDRVARGLRQDWRGRNVG